MPFDEELMVEGEDETFVFGDEVLFGLDVFHIDRRTHRRTHRQEDR